MLDYTVHKTVYLIVVFYTWKYGLHTNNTRQNEVKSKLSISMPLRDTGGTESWLHSFFTSTLKGGEVISFMP